MTKTRIPSISLFPEHALRTDLTNLINRAIVRYFAKRQPATAADMARLSEECATLREVLGRLQSHYENADNLLL